MVRRSLAGMNWRRGLLLAGIHLAVAAAVIAMDGVRGSSLLRNEMREGVATLRNVAWQESDQVSFDLCHGGFVHYSDRPRDVIVKLANLPASAVSGWMRPCPARWSLAGLIESRYFNQQIRVNELTSVGFCLLISAQWLLVGGLPLSQPRHWFAEPGAFITLCTVIAACPVLLGAILSLVGTSPVDAAVAALDWFGQFVALFAAAAWFWWFGLLVWKILRAGWRLASGRSPAAA
jgi:hypothetical protein